MRGINLENDAKIFGETFKNEWKELGEYIADIEKFKVIKHEHFYSLWDSDNITAFCSLAGNVVDRVYVYPEYRGQKLFSMMLWFFKTRLGISSIELGQVHSKAMQEAINGLSRFDKVWINKDTGERRPFNQETNDEYYSYIKPTEWRLVLENDGNFNWPMFKNKDFIREAYLPYID